MSRRVPKRIQHRVSPFCVSARQPDVIFSLSWPAVYLLDEVARLVGSKAENVTAAVETLVNRLQARSPVVKQKALRVIKHCCIKGSPEFKRSMARQSAIVRDLTNFRCPPDPFKGDIPWKRVQEAAREALAALHAAPTISHTYEPSNSSGALGSRIQGFGSDAIQSTSSTKYEGDIGVYKSHKLMAFGNSPMDPSAAQRGLMNTLSSSVKTLGDRATGAIHRPNHQRLYSGDGDFGGTVQRTQDAVIVRQPGAGVTTSIEQGAPKSAEGRVVNTFCQSSGLRATPSGEDLRTFMQTICVLDATAVSQLLLKKVESSPWQEALRSLCALEAVISAGGQMGGEMAVCCQSNPSSLRKATLHPQSTVKHHAHSVLKLIGAETLPGESHSLHGGPQTHPDLLLGEESHDLKPSTHQTDVEGMDSLLAGLTMASSTSTVETNTNVDQIFGLDVPAATPFETRAGDFDLMGDFQSATVPVAQTLTSSPTFGVDGGAGIDLLDTMMVPSLLTPVSPPAAKMAVKAPVYDTNNTSMMNSLSRAKSSMEMPPSKDTDFSFITNHMNTLKKK